MKIIAPSILSADFSRFREEVELVEAAGGDWIHFDAMDGHFVPNLTFGAGILKAIRPHTSLPIDAHLMIEYPEQYIKDYAAAGADYITVHVESTPHIHRAIQMIKNEGVKAGVALNPGTPFALIEPLLDLVDLVLVMTVNPGFGGQSFLPETVEKIKQAEAYRKNHEKNYVIQVDGGINHQTIGTCHRAGADIFVAGSYVFSDPDHSVSEQITRLRQADE